MLRPIPIALRKRKDLGPLLSFLTTSHAEVIEERFDHPLVRGALAAMPPFCWMTQDGTGWALIYIAMCHRTGSARFRGGTGALTNALNAWLRDHGCVVRTSAQVRQAGRRNVAAWSASNWTPGSSTCVRSRRVLASVQPTLQGDVGPDAAEGKSAGTPAAAGRADPHQRAGDHDAEDRRGEVSGKLSTAKHNAWRSDGLDLCRPIMSWQTYGDHLDSWNDVVGRRWPKEICFIGIVPSRMDPTQAPEGQDTFWLWSGIVPRNPTQPWETMREEIGNRVLKDCSTVYEGLDSLEIGRRVFSAPDLEQRFHVPDGNVYHVEPVGMRFGPLRPARGFGSYETPVPGLWITGAGTHPTGGISGIPGMVAAKTMIKRGHAERGRS